MSKARTSPTSAIARKVVFLLVAACSGAGGTGTATTDSDTAGTGSTSTTTGEPAGPDGMYCMERCNVDADCKREGQDVGWICNNGTCEYGPCTSDIQCWARFWSKCASQVDCEGGQVCVDIGGGEGRCANKQNDFIPCDTTVMLPPIEGGAPTEVCAYIEEFCTVETGVCEPPPCQSDYDCLYLVAPTCDTKTGLCGCSSNADCEAYGDPEYSVCMDNKCVCGSDVDCLNSARGFHCGQTGLCGCASDADCDDTCYDGLCGCSSSTSCEWQTFDGTMLTCESH